MTFRELQALADRVFECIAKVQSEVASWSSMSGLGKDRVLRLCECYRAATIADLEYAKAGGPCVPAAVELVVVRVKDLTKLKLAQEEYLKSVFDCDWLEESLKAAGAMRPATSFGYTRLEA